MNLWKAPWQRFVEVLREENLHRAYFVTEPDAEAPEGFRVRASHPRFDSIAELLAGDGRDFDRHEGLFFEIGPESNHLLFACLHWTHRGQGAGGLRYWGYESLEDFVRDGLRLSRGMGHKNALAGLWWGGGNQNGFWTASADGTGTPTQIGSSTDEPPPAPSFGGAGDA